MDLTPQMIQAAATHGMEDGVRLRRHDSRYSGPGDLAPAPRLTRALVEGTPQQNAFMGPALFLELRRPEWKITIIQEDNSHLFVYDTERGIEGVRARGKFIPGTADFEMALFAFELGIDRRLYRKIADGAFRLPLGAAIRARRAVELDLENRMAMSLSTPALWPAAHRADQSGAPWNLAGGDFKAAFDIGVTQIISVNNGYLRQHVDGFMTHPAFNAAQSDPTWLAWRAANSLNPIDQAAMADYLQIRSLTVRDATVSLDGVVQSLWGPSAYLVLNTGAADLNTEFGSRPFARLHRQTNPVVFAPYLENRRGTDYWPFEDSALPVVHNFTTGYFMHDMVG